MMFVGSETIFIFFPIQPILIGSRKHPRAYQVCMCVDYSLLTGAFGGNRNILDRIRKILVYTY